METGISRASGLLARVVLVDRRLYFYTNPRKDVYRHPRPEIPSYGDGEWLRLSGEAVFESENHAGNDQYVLR